MKDMIYSLFGTAAHAVEFDPTGALNTSGLSSQDPVVTVLNVIQIGLGVLGLVFVVLVIVGGFMWMTSGGKEDQIKKAKKLLISAVIGLAIVLGSYGISEYVWNILFEATAGTPTLPTP